MAAISTSTVSVMEYACDIDSDCGTDGLVGSQFCSGSGIYQNYITWTCDNPGTNSSSCSSSATARLQTACDSGQICSGASCQTALVPTPNIVAGSHFYYPTALVPTITPEQTPAPAATPAIAPMPSPPPAVESPAITPAIASYLPAGISELAQKIPQLKNIISNLGIKTASDAAYLSNYNIFLPGLKEITGSGFSNLTSEQKSKIPEDVVFVLLGNGNIDAASKLDFSKRASDLQTVNLLPNKPVRLVLKPSRRAEEVNGYVFFKNFSVLKFNYNDNDNDGIYVADINSPAIEGQYQIATENINITTLIDPEGYVYEDINGKELLISDAAVSLYKLNSENKYELWQAKDYGQENPQITGSTGKYSYLVPEGTYYLAVKSPGYYSYQSDAISVREGKEIHSNIALKKQTDLFSFFDWTTIAIIILFCLVIFNFYKDWKNGISHKN
jgi:hypothetical protein